MLSVWTSPRLLIIGVRSGRKVHPKIISTGYFSGITLNKTEYLPKTWLHKLWRIFCSSYFLHPPFWSLCMSAQVYSCFELPHQTRLNDPHLSLAAKARISLLKPISTHPRDSPVLLYINCWWEYQRSKLISGERKDDRGSDAGCPSPEATVSSPGGQTAAGVNLQFGALACIQATVRGSCVQKVLTEV